MAAAYAAATTAKAARSPGLQAADGRPQIFDRPRGDARGAGVRFAERKAVCLVPDSFRITMDEDRNDRGSATGRLRFEVGAHGRTRNHGGTHQFFAAGPREKDAQGKVCDCDCMTYRQYIRIGREQTQSRPTA